MRCPVLVGRATELKALRETFERARTGHGAWVRCSAVDRSTAYRPVAEALLGLAPHVPSPVPEAVAPYAAAVARFVPPWRTETLVPTESPAVLGASLLRLLA